MRILRPLGVALALAPGCAALLAAACTSAPDYRAPANPELAAEAEALATGDAHARLDDAGPAVTEAAIEAEIRRLRQAAIEAGN